MAATSFNQAAHAVLDLNTGKTLPTVGLGAMEYGNVVAEEEKPRIRNSIAYAIKSGYRLIDTSQIYGTEGLVGEGIRASGVPRSEIIVVTKVPENFHHDPGTALKDSLQALGLDYVDVYLMHWPCAWAPDMSRPLPFEESPTFVETYKMMEKLVGPQCLSIGVSNFTQRTLEILLNECTIKPVVNQIEVHPLNPNLKLVPWCQERGIQVMAWAPLAGGPKSVYADSSKIYENSTLTSIASRHEISVGVTILSWLVQRKISVIPHSSSETRLVENLKVVALTDQEVQQINEIHEQVGKLRLIDNVTFVWMDVIPGKGRTIYGWTPQEMGWVDDQGNWLT